MKPLSTHLFYHGMPLVGLIWLCHPTLDARVSNLWKNC